MKVLTDYTTYRNISRGLVISFGNFDGVHTGHMLIVNKICEIARKNDYISALMTFTPHPKEFFNPKTECFSLTNLKQKISILKTTNIELLYAIEFTKGFSTISAEEFIKNILINYCNTKFIVVGNSTKFGKNREGNVKFLKKLSNVYNYKVIEIDTNSTYCSSSHIRNLLKEGKIKQANKLLGRPYQIQGTIIIGNQRGQKIGFPTANMNLGSYLIPRLGVFFAKTTIDKKVLYGLVNIGNRPTFTNENRTILEMHIFDFTNDDLYGKELIIEILDFIRPEKKFKNADQLKSQIKQDIAIAKNMIYNDHKKL